LSDINCFGAVLGARRDIKFIGPACAAALFAALCIGFGPADPGLGAVLGARRDIKFIEPALAAPPNIIRFTFAISHHPSTSFATLGDTIAALRCTDYLATLFERSTGRRSRLSSCLGLHIERLVYPVSALCISRSRGLYVRAKRIRWLLGNASVVIPFSLSHISTSRRKPSSLA